MKVPYSAVARPLYGTCHRDDLPVIGAVVFEVGKYHPGFFGHTHFGHIFSGCSQMHMVHQRLPGGISTLPGEIHGRIVQYRPGERGVQIQFGVQNSGVHMKAPGIVQT